MNLVPKDYLGDSVYAADDGFHVVLTTENRLGADNTILLDLHVLAALQRYVERVADARKEKA